MPERPVALCRQVAIFAAVSTGSLALSKSIGLPLVCLGISGDPTATVATPNARHHASAAPWFDAVQPFREEAGWADWRPVPFEPGLDAGHRPTGMALTEGCIRLDLPVDGRSATFTRDVFAAVQRFRLDAVVTSPAWFHARSAACETLHGPARYTLADHDLRGLGATKVDDLFVIDPGWHLGLVASLANVLRRRATGSCDDA